LIQKSRRPETPPNKAKRSRAFIKKVQVFKNECIVKAVSFPIGGTKNIKTRMRIGVPSDLQMLDESLGAPILDLETFEARWNGTHTKCSATIMALGKMAPNP